MFQHRMRAGTASGVGRARWAGHSGSVSDSYIRVIPTDPGWQPTQKAAVAAVAYVAGLFAGPGDDVEEVEHRFYDRVTLIDAGESTTRISCSRCDGEIGLRWFYDAAGDNEAGLGCLDARVPCCGAVVSLATLRYDWPVGFARFEVTAMNATRAKYELDAEELAHVTGLLGHLVTQILAHY